MRRTHSREASKGTLEHHVQMQSTAASRSLSRGSRTTIQSEFALSTNSRPVHLTARVYGIHTSKQGSSQLSQCLDENETWMAGLFQNKGL
jgi:hypothetical protein